MKNIKEDELKLHIAVNSAWLAVDGAVYDVSSFIDEHPGGVEVIKDVLGKDATEEFENVGHSKAALDMMKKLQIGTLEGYQRKDGGKGRTRTAYSNNNSTSFADTKKQPTIFQHLSTLALLVFAIALIFYLYNYRL